MRWSFTQSDLDTINEEWYREKVCEMMANSSSHLRSLVSTAYKVGYNSRQIHDMLAGRKPA